MAPTASSHGRDHGQKPPGERRQRKPRHLEGPAPREVKTGNPDLPPGTAAGELRKAESTASSGPSGRTGAREGAGGGRCETHAVSTERGADAPRLGLGRREHLCIGRCERGRRHQPPVPNGVEAAEEFPFQRPRLVFSPLHARVRGTALLPGRSPRVVHSPTPPTAAGAPAPSPPWDGPRNKCALFAAARVGVTLGGPGHRGSVSPSLCARCRRQEPGVEGFVTSEDGALGSFAQQTC